VPLCASRSVEVISFTTPEAKARVEIDRQLEAAGWTLQYRDEMNLAAHDAIGVREFKLHKGHGYVDYMLFLDGKAVGVCEAKPAGFPVRSVEFQARKYVEGLPAALDAPYKPLPFATGEETVLINHFDPMPRTRVVFTFHRPETLREWLTADTLDGWLKRSGGFYTAADDTKPSTLRARLRAMPPVDLPGLWRNKVDAVANIEKYRTQIMLQNDSKRITRLRQGVLKWAFEGKLVDQDPNDEPAEKLLDRIREERAASTPVKKSRKRKAKTDS
jgi:hypothetical protein